MAAKVTFQVGPVSLRTKMEPAVDAESSDRFTVCTGKNEGEHAPSRTTQKNFCPVCKREHSSAFGFTQRGTEVGGQIVVLSTDELAAAAGSPRTGRDKTPPIQVAFHSREKVYASTVAADSVQNIFPERGYEKPYVVLREAMVAHPDVVACVIWAPKSANSLWVIEVVGDRLVASKRCWPEQVRVTPAAPMVDYLDAEVTAMGAFIEIETSDFDLSVYSDQSKTGIADLIASKSGEAPAQVVSTAPEADLGIPDLLASLQLAVKAATRPAKRAATKRAPAKKVAAKKVAAKRVPAKPAAKKVAAKRATPRRATAA